MSEVGTPEQRLDFPAVVEVIDVPELVFDAEGDVVVWNGALEELLAMARTGEAVRTTGTSPLAAVVESTWENVQIAGATLEWCLGDATVERDRNRLLCVFEILFRNAVGRNETPLVVRVGTLDAREGFYVEDSGRGIPADERDEVFEYGDTTSDTGSGFGLGIVRETVDAHGWTLTVTDSDDDGARFESETP